MKAHLRISTYQGIVPDASHYMGELKIGDEPGFSVEGVLDQKWCLELNRDAKRKGDTYRYKVGSTSSRFLDRESLIKRTLELIAAEHPQVTILFEGERSILDPQPVLFGPEPIKTELNKLVAEAEANDWWEGDEAKMEDISQRWEAALAWS